jgi:death-on-curing protein
VVVRRREPQWLARTVVDAMHGDQLREHGGVAGVRDENALESALARARQKWAYGEERDLAVLAAAYGFGLATNHPYLDGNKRIALLAIATFLGINGYDLSATDAEVVTAMVALAAGRLSEEELSQWIRDHMTRIG